MDDILFRNDISLKDGRDSSGASAFLINYKGNNYAVTAKHMLNDMMGFEPPVLPSNFNKEVQSWEITSLAGNKKVTITDIIKPDDNWENDILILNVQSQKTELNTMKILNTSLSEGEHLYIVGCPYDEVSCKQNIYEIIFLGRKDDTIFFDWPNKNISSRGFSGAPILNSEGKVVATYTGYYVENDKNVYQGQSVEAELKRIFSN